MVLSEGSAARSPSGSGRVVVGVHGSVSSRQALRQAASIARQRGWDLELVTAWPDADEVLIHEVPGRYMVARGRAVESMREALASLGPDGISAVSSVVVNARPAAALVERSAGADLLVVGAGRPEPELERPGVAPTCSRAAPCPVVVVPAAGADPTTARAGSGRTPRHRRSRGGARSVPARAG